jgi:hypothetical protein
VHAQAAHLFSSRFAPVDEAERQRSYSGPTGRVTITAHPEGGHYTRVEVSTDQVGESEVDKYAKRFLAELHRAAAPTYAVRGAY